MGVCTHKAAQGCCFRISLDASQSSTENVCTKDSRHQATCLATSCNIFVLQQGLVWHSTGRSHPGRSLLLRISVLGFLHLKDNAHSGAQCMASGRVHINYGGSRGTSSMPTQGGPVCILPYTLHVCSLYQRDYMYVMQQVRTRAAGMLVS